MTVLHSLAPSNLAPSIFAPFKLAPLRLAELKLAPVKSAPSRFVSRKKAFKKFILEELGIVEKQSENVNPAVRNIAAYKIIKKLK